MMHIVDLSDHHITLRQLMKVISIEIAALFRSEHNTEQSAIHSLLSVNYNILYLYN